MNAPGGDPKAVPVDVKVVNGSIPESHKLDQASLSGIEGIVRNWNKLCPLPAINLEIDLLPIDDDEVSPIYFRAEIVAFKRVKDCGGQCNARNPLRIFSV